MVWDVQHEPAMRSFALVAAALIAPLLVACGADTGDAPVAEDDYTGAGEARPAGTPGAPGEGSSDAPGAGTEPGTGAALPACLAMPACDGATGPTLGPKREWAHYANMLTSKAGSAYHRGRDRVIKTGAPQVVIGKFTYSYADVDIEGEDVDVFVERGCGGSWEKLGTTKTTFSGEHADVDDVSDSGGRVYFEIPAAKALAPGRHRVRMVVAADQTFADAILDVVPDGTPMFVSDVDGTLTESEHAEWRALYEGVDPPAHPKAAEALSALAAKGIRPVYLTARPEWLMGKTHEFLKNKGFPPGIVITTTGLTGISGSAARDYKTAALARLADQGARVIWAFGNRDTDTDAYDAAEIKPVDHRVFLRIDDPHGGRRIEAYSEILPLTQAQPAICK